MRSCCMVRFRSNRCVLELWRCPRRMVRSCRICEIFCRGCRRFCSNRSLVCVQKAYRTHPCGVVCPAARARAYYCRCHRQQARDGTLARSRHVRNIKPKLPMTQTFDPSTPLKRHLEIHPLHVLPTHLLKLLGCLSST